MVTKERKKAKA